MSILIFAIKFRHLSLKFPHFMKMISVSASEFPQSARLLSEWVSGLHFNEAVFYRRCQSGPKTFDYHLRFLLLLHCAWMFCFAIWFNRNIATSKQGGEDPGTIVAGAQKLLITNVRRTITVHFVSLPLSMIIIQLKTERWEDYCRHITTSRGGTKWATTLTVEPSFCFFHNSYMHCFTFCCWCPGWEFEKHPLRRSVF